MKSFHNKYNAKRTTIDGVAFPSALEAATFCHLLMLKKCGEISEIEHYFTVRLTRAQISWKADFRVFDIKNNRYTLVEAKGCETETWRLKLRLYRVYGEYPLWIFKGSYRSLRLAEIVIPDDFARKEKP